MRQSYYHNMDMASHWALILRDACAEPEDIKRAVEWIDQSQANRDAFDRAERFLSICDSVPADSAFIQRLRLGSRGNIGFGYFVGPRTGWAIAASFIFAIGGLLLLLGRDMTVSPPLAANYATRIGESRDILLPDGSSLRLAGGSAVSVSYTKTIRGVVLNNGEAVFAVAHDVTRPFIVSSGNGTTTAVGTAFDVHRDSEGATVTVLHGRVAVLAAGAKFASKTYLGPSTQVSYKNNGMMTAVRRAAIGNVLAWREGNLQFFARPLADVVADLNRYSMKRIVIEGDDIQTTLITGSVKFDGILEWLRGLAAIKGLDLVERSDHIVLTARGPFDRRKPSFRTLS